MIVLAVIIVLLALFLFLRVVIIAEYSENGAIVSLKLGFLRINLYPTVEKEKRKKKKERRKKIRKEAEKQKEKGGKLSEFKNYISLVKKSLSRLRRRLLIHELILRVVIATDDAARTGMCFGLASAGLGILEPLTEDVLRIKKRDVSVGFSFTETETSVYFKISFSLAVWAVIYITSGIAYNIAKIRFKTQSK